MLYEAKQGTKAYKYIRVFSMQNLKSIKPT